MAMDVSGGRAASAITGPIVKTDRSHVSGHPQALFTQGVDRTTGDLIVVVKQRIRIGKARTKKQHHSRAAPALPSAAR